jgi:hypothetical protein
MARNASSRSIVFAPSSVIADFLGTGYASHGVGQTSLSNLVPIYPSSSLLALSSLRRLSSDRNRRAGDKGPRSDESAFSVIMFKRFTTILPPGLTVDTFAKFFTELFTFQTLEEEQDFNTYTKALLKNKHYIVMAITAPTFLSAFGTVACNNTSLFRYLLLTIDLPLLLDTRCPNDHLALRLV